MSKIKKNITEGLRETIVDFLLKLALFDRLSGDELNTVAGYMNFLEIDRGTYLFKEGARGDYVCFVVSGRMDVFKMSMKGERVMIASLPKGSTLGEMAIIDDTSRSATARASEDSTLVILSKRGFDRILDQHPKTGIKILKGIARLLSLNMRRTSSLLADHLPPV